MREHRGLLVVGADAARGSDGPRRPSSAHSGDFELIPGCVEARARETSATLARAYPGVGGVVTFEGRVRNHHAGREVTRLSYSAYAPLAAHEAEGILSEARVAFGLDYARALHGFGELEIGDMAVWIQVAAAHRNEAFEACRFVIDEIKRRLPIWKHEYYEDGTYEWVYCAH